MSEKNEPFFVHENGKYQPTQVSRGPWNPRSLHGRVMIGLLGWEIERLYGAPDFVPARLTVDMYKLPELDPVEIVTRVVRSGGRIKVIDADFISKGEPMGRATCQLLRRTENAPGNVWKPAPWDAPRPEDIPPPDDARAGMGGMWAMRPIEGAFGTVGKKKTWMKEVRAIVDDDPMTPFTRVALAADFSSPFANAGDQGLGYINSDVTIYLHRLPVQEWIGFEVVNHQATDGVAIGECLLHDVEGPIGSASCCALAQKRKL